MSKKLYTTLYIYMMSKKYTLSDNMCLVHISAIVMLTVICTVFILQCYDTVGWVMWPVKSSPKWRIMCRVGRSTLLYLFNVAIKGLNLFGVLSYCMNCNTGTKYYYSCFPSIIILLCCTLLTFILPHLRCAVGLEEREYSQNCLCGIVMVLCTIIMVHSGMSSSYR